MIETGSQYNDGAMLVDFSLVKKPQDYLAVAIATSGGAGLLPAAPGTFGTLVAVPLAIFLSTWTWELRLLAWTLIFAAGVWASQHVEKIFNSSDNQSIVIDEVLGYGLTTAVLDFPSHSWLAWVTAFLLFRILDVVKLQPARSVDRWSKKQPSAWLRGFGVIADDLVAGLQGVLIMFLLLQLEWLSS